MTDKNELVWMTEIYYVYMCTRKRNEEKIQQNCQFGGGLGDKGG